jgi:hypothetical protein
MPLPVDFLEAVLFGLPVSTGQYQNPIGPVPPETESIDRSDFFLIDQITVPKLFDSVDQLILLKSGQPLFNSKNLQIRLLNRRDNLAEKRMIENEGSNIQYCISHSNGEQ